MEGSDIGFLVMIGILVLAWLSPILIILSSNKTTGSEKLAWVLAVVFVSWFAWVFYFLLAPIKSRNSSN